jgi:hypothetical protein
MATDLAALEYACAFVRPAGYFHVVSRFAGNQPTSLQAIAEAEMQALAEHGSVELVEVLLAPHQVPVSNLRIGVAAADLSGDAETFAGSAIFRIVLPSWRRTLLFQQIWAPRTGSPVVRQAHNLKVTGSNPVPATRKKPTNSTSWWAFSCANSPEKSDPEPIQEVLRNTRLFDAVVPCVGSSMSHARHMESDAMFANRSCIKSRTCSCFTK